MYLLSSKRIECSASVCSVCKRVCVGTGQGTVSVFSADFNHRYLLSLLMKSSSKKPKHFQAFVVIDTYHI